MSRPAIAHIKLDAFRHNYRVAKRLHGGKALAVIKANAYGHGAVKCAKAIENEADGFAVACIEEALTLRQAGIQSPILLLEGFFEASELAEVVQHQLWLVIHHRWQAEALLAAKLKSPVHIWLKMDTGMHRVGLEPSEYLIALQQLNQHENIASITAMSHFANADSLDNAQTLAQLALFQTILKSATNVTKLQGSSLANTAAILAWPPSHLLWSRPGIMLYGADPLFNEPQLDNQLRAVMQLSSKILSTRYVKKAESIGYGSLIAAQRDTLVGVVACGYADGYPRSASQFQQIGAPVAVDGHITYLIGRVSMDMLFVDLTDLPKAGIHSEVELWGEHVSANEVAKAAGTIAYELFCNVKRVAFRYSDNMQIQAG